MQLDIDEQATIDLQINNAKRLVEDVVTELTIDIKQLYQFSYELLKHDVEQKYVFDLLNGQVRQSELVNIIMSNQWNSKTKKMEVKKGIKFKIVANTNHIFGVNNAQRGHKLKLQSLDHADKADTGF